MCSYVMWPIAFIIGIDTDECQESAKLIGLKVFATEVLAYQELGKSVDAGLLNVRDNNNIFIFHYFCYDCSFFYFTKRL